MICNQCGAVLPAGAHFCSSCGTVLAAQPVMLDRVSKHLPTLGVLWLIYAVLRVLKTLTGVMVMHGLFGHGRVFGPMAMDTWQPFTAAIWPVIWTSLLISAVGAFVTAYGLMKRQPWGRVVAIVFGVWALIHPLLGTALGIYTLWVLAPGVSGVTYARLSRSEQ